ncbi:MAG: glycosyltransferase family 4 protein [Armatimonadota bacterium]|nr:glycosyltransferase family 4 protein [Armatimonadota bacterium]
MRVGIFTESYPPLINGVSTSVQTLIAHLERAGHEVFVFTSRYPRYQDERPGVFRYPSINALVEPDYVVPIPFSPRIARAIPKLGLDIVHSQSPFFLGLLARRVARTLNLPHIATNHTLYTEYAHYMPFLTAGTTRRMLVRWMRGFYDTCDRVLAPSELTKRVLQEGYGVQAPVTVIPTAIPAPPYVLSRPPEIKQEFGLPPDARLLLYVGRLAPEKNLDLLLRAFAQISAQTSDTYLILAGSGKSRGALEARARSLGIHRRTRFAGFLGRTKLDPLYQASDLFLFPSKTETQGLAVGEALASGLPCIVVNAGGAPESVRDGIDGILVEDDAAQMAARTLELLADPLRRQRLAEEAKRGAAGRTPESVGGRMVAVYEELIAARREAAGLVVKAPFEEKRDAREGKNKT